MNETLKTISSRYSCRNYTGELPSREQLEAIALAAVQSPSANNMQNWRIIVVTNAALIEEMEKIGQKEFSRLSPERYEQFMARGGSLFYHAPCMFIIAMDAKIPTTLDAGITAENIALAASSLGLGNVICGMARFPFDSDMSADFKKRLGFPDGFEFAIAVLVGVSSAPGKPHEADTGKISWLE
jgi:nitroreductase